MEPSAIVIGASGGIGTAVADALSQDRRYGPVRRFSRSAGGADHLDIADEASIAAAVRSVAEGPAPTLVFVATGVLHSGEQPERSYRAMTADHLMRDFQVNAVGPALVAKHFLPLMPKDRRAVFVALSARVGSISDNRLGGWHAYRASKAALNMVLKTLAVEVARSHPLAVVAGLHPGTTATALSAPFQKGVAPDKLFTPAFAAEHLLAVAEGLTPADSGGIFAWDGQAIAP